MPKPISSLNLFPTYESREAYEQAAGKPCPAWNPTRQPKNWFDPDATKKRTIGGVPYMDYDRVLVGWDQVLRQAIFESVSMPVDEAKTVNIAPTGTGMTNVPGADASAVRVPMRELEEDEVILPRRDSIIVLLEVWKADEIPSPATASGFTADDRALLKRIAAKVGV